MVLGRRGLVLTVALAVTVACGLDAGVQSSSDSIVSGTWSIVAVDVKAGETGIALASCVRADLSISRSKNSRSRDKTQHVTYRVLAGIGPPTPIELARLITGKGVIVAQAQVDQHNTDRVDRASARLLAGGTAQSAVKAATSDDSQLETRQYGVVTFDTDAASFTGSETSDDSQLETRQYGVVTFDTDAASFTGSETLDWSGAATDQSVSVQGNILVGPEVVRGALEAFREVMSKPDAVLSDALITALEAGAAQGGDKRCPKKQTALSAFIAVAQSGDEGDIPSLWLAVPSQLRGTQNPVTILRQAYNEDRSSPAQTSRVDGDGLHVAWWGLTALALPLAGLAFWINRRVGRRMSR
jgi:uncharacterized Ntn-hydrolase superfamily protein